MNESTLTKGRNMSESKATIEALAEILNELGRIEAMVRADYKATREWSTAESKRAVDEMNEILNDLNRRLVEMHSNALEHNGPLRLRIAAELLANSDHRLDRQSKALGWALETAEALIAAEKARP